MKKIFCIFAVVLILIMATVPCFAETVNYADNLFDRFYVLGSEDYLTFSSSSPFSVIGYFSYTQGHRYYLQYEYISGSYTGSTSSYYFCFFTYLDSYVGFPISNVTSNYSFIFVPGSSVSDTRITIRSFDDLVFNVRIFDITDLDFISSPSEGDSYFSWFVNSFPSYQIHNSVSNPLISFYGSIRHVFDYFSNIFNQSSSFYQPFLFIIGVVFILMVIMIIFLVFRRCRS